MFLIGGEYHLACQIPIYVSNIQECIIYFFIRSLVAPELDKFSHDYLYCVSNSWKARFTVLILDCKLQEIMLPNFDSVGNLPKTLKIYVTEERYIYLCFDTYSIILCHKEYYHKFCYRKLEARRLSLHDLPRVCNENRFVLSPQNAETAPCNWPEPTAAHPLHGRTLCIYFWGQVNIIKQQSVHHYSLPGSTSAESKVNCDLL